LFAELLEGGRFFEVFAEDEAGAFDAFAGGALGASAEEFAAGRAEEQEGGEFKGFATEPDFARGLEDRTLLEALDELEMEGAEAFGFRDPAECRGGGRVCGGGGIRNDLGDERIEIFFL
jgi:hypothetical protein